MVTLLNIPISPFGTKVKMAMLEKGIAFDTREPDLEAAQAGNDHQLTSTSSPRLEIPLLIDGDLRVFDSTIILEYLEDRWPEPALLPVSAAERARVRMIEDLCDTTYEAVVWGIYEVTTMGRASEARQAELLARGQSKPARYSPRIGRRGFFNRGSMPACRYSSSQPWPACGQASTIGR